MPATQESVLAAIEKQNGELVKAVGDLTKTLSQPDLSRVHHDADGRLTGFMEGTEESVDLVIGGEGRGAQMRKTYGQQRKENRRLLKSMGYQPYGEFKSFSEFVRAGLEGAKSEKFNGRVHSHLKAIQGMSETIGSDGGYTVFPEFNNNIIDRVYNNDLWGMTDNYSVSGNSMTFLANAETSRANGSRHGGLRGYYVGEGSTITKSKPTTREVTLKLVKIGVVAYLTEELLADTGTALQQYVTRKVSEEFNFMLGDGLINGTGVGQLHGMLNFPSLVSVAVESGQVAPNYFQTENIVKMASRFFAPNFGSAVWLHNQDIGPYINTMTLGIGAAGVVTFMPPGGLSGSPYSTLQGRPMIPTEFNATRGTQGDLLLADPGQILTISKGGVAQAVSSHVEFLTDQLALRFTIRVNSGPWESAPITPYKGSANTQSNFVTLDTRS